MRVMIWKESSTNPLSDPVIIICSTIEQALIFSKVGCGLEWNGEENFLKQLRPFELVMKQCMSDAIVTASMSGREEE